MVAIDLGCGLAKSPGFIGVDRYPLPGVDVIADLDHPLPFRADSADLIYASHSLEHVRDLMFSMREIFRVCKHGAQVCIVAPYSEQKLNIANPYHRWSFNEHTPRFWTHFPQSPTPGEDYFHPNSSLWGLSKSDNSDPGLDLRLLRMEFFYFPEYRGYPEAELRRLRQQRLDVCDQVMFHLLAWKRDDPQGEEYERLAASFVPYEPAYVTQRRKADQEDAQAGSAPPGAAASGEGKSPPALWEGVAAVIDRLSPVMSSMVSGLREAERAARRECGDTRLYLETVLAKGGAEERRRWAAEARADALQSAVQRLESSERASLEQLESLRRELSSLREKAASQDTLVSALEEQLRQRDARHAELLRLWQQQDELWRREQASLAAAEERRALALEQERRTLAQERDTLRLEVTQLQARLAEAQAAHQELQREWADTGANLRRVADSQAQELAELRAKAAQAQQALKEAAVARAELEAQRGVAAWFQSKDVSLTRELEAARAASERDAALLRRWEAGRQGVAELLERIRQAQLSTDLPALAGLRGAPAPWEGLPAAFATLRDFCSRRFARRQLLCLFSEELGSVPYVEYPMQIELERVTRLHVALASLLPPQAGEAGIEIVSPAGDILAHVTIPLANKDTGAPLAFSLPTPVPRLQEGWLLRVFARYADTPVWIYEMTEVPRWRRAGPARQPLFYAE